MFVLLVEDEPLIREIMSEALRDAGHDVLEMENGDVAIEMLRKPPKQFTILVTDFHMPGHADGSQVAAHVRQMHPAIPVIIMSGRPDIFKASWRTDLGYVFMKKPYLPSALVKRIRDMTNSTNTNA